MKANLYTKIYFIKFIFLCEKFRYRKAIIFQFLSMFLYKIITWEYNFGTRKLACYIFILQQWRQRNTNIQHILRNFLEQRLTFFSMLWDKNKNLCGTFHLTGRQCKTKRIIPHKKIARLFWVFQVCLIWSKNIMRIGFKEWFAPNDIKTKNKTIGKTMF